MDRKSLISTSILLIITLATLAQNGATTFEFIENKGQWDQTIKFRGDLLTGSFLLNGMGFSVVQHNPRELDRIMRQVHSHGGTLDSRNQKGESTKQLTDIGGTRHQPNEKIVLHSHLYRVAFSGAAERPAIVPDKVLPTYNNYFLGNDPSKWASNVKIYQAITYKNVYPNIDVRYYSEAGKLKYDLIVNPGGSVESIAMKYEGAEKLSIRNNELIIKTSVGEAKELYPYSFQYDPAKGRTEVSCKYEIVNGNTVKFKIKNYNRNAILVIDPTLIFSSFTGSVADNYGFTATPGPDGSLYSGSIAFGVGFPVTPGAFQTNFGGGSVGGGRANDMAIMKFSPNGSQRLYATYIGGNGNDYPHSLVCDPQGNLVVMGRTYSSNFPGTTFGPLGGCDLAVTKLNASGTNIIGSMRIGGTNNDGLNIEDIQISQTQGIRSLIRNYGDDSRSEVILDGANNIVIAAQAQSPDFPIVGGFQATKGGGQDGVVLKINPSCNAVVWSSFLGGSSDDGAFVLAINPVDGNIYVGGATVSNNLPGSTAGVIQPAFAGGETDGFISIVNPNGNSIIRTTYLGTNSVDLIYGLKFDRSGFPYVMGVTRGSWTVVNAAFSNPNSKQFVAKLRPDLSGYQYSTVYGSGTPKPNLSPVAFLVDRCENVYISGWGGIITPGQTQDPYDHAGLIGMPVTNDAIKRTTDNMDFYFIVIEKNAASLLYGSFFGQNGGFGEHVDGGTSRFDEEGVIYQAMCANCGGDANFPTTPGVVAPINGALPSGCNLAAVKISFNFAGVAAGPKAYINGVPDSIGCIPLTFEFRDTVRNARRYEWDFGDGSPGVITTTQTVSHLYNGVGQYTVRLIAVDSTTCNIRDTAFITVIARDDLASLGFNPVKLPPCESLSYRFDNLSTFPAGKPFDPTSFIWDFGDGSRVVAGPGSVTHSYSAPGTYKVRLILSDTSYCNSPDSLTVDLRIAPLVDALFETPPNGCAPYNAVFNNVSQAGQSFFWDFGDGNTSTQVNPTHLYNNVGTYNVRLIAIDSATCNIIDSAFQTISVHPLPTADFSHSPVVPEVNKPTIFTNLSTGGVRFKWLFGDGDSVIKTTPDTVLHQYNATGTYQACLVVFNQFDCTDTICKPVQAEIVPLLDVPNAFTPGRFGKNSIIRVEGFGIARMTWRIYNRWGQKVFESASRSVGWDGTFKGQIQPQDVYAYTLEVDFSDGTKARKTGDITLLR